MTTLHDMGGITLIVDGVRVGATSPGNLGTELTGAEIILLDGITAGTVTASKALVVDGSKDLDGLNDLTVENDLSVEGSIQCIGQTAVVADSTPATLSFTGGLHVVTNTTDANDVIDLPVNVAADVGKEIHIFASEACELQSADASATVNGVVVGATNEAALAAGSYTICKLVADNTWIAQHWIANGTPTQLVPDAL